MTHIMIVAGEASGDLHAAHLIQDLRKHKPDIHFSGIGGREMQALGVSLIDDLAQHGIMGFIEVLTHFKRILRAFRKIKTALLGTKPDLLILVDYPGFNLRVARYAKQLHIPVLYYISPQLWAWKPKRMKIIQKNVENMAVILPFEKKLYEAAGVSVRFVGHPLVPTVKTTCLESDVRKHLGLKPNSLVIGLMPGSRWVELKHLLPTILKSCMLIRQKTPEVEFVLLLASTFTKEEIAPYLKKVPLDIKIAMEHRYDVMGICHSLIIASGTATLEAAILEKPMVIVYKTSILNYMLATQLIRVKYIGLCNLLAQKMVVPELLQHDFTAKHVSREIFRWIEAPAMWERVQKELGSVRATLEHDRRDSSLSEFVMEILAKLSRSEGLLRAPVLQEHKSVDVAD